MAIKKKDQLREYLREDGYESLDTESGFLEAVEMAIEDHWDLCGNCKCYYGEDRTCEAPIGDDRSRCVSRLLKYYSGKVKVESEGI